jgi:hypothetical protein
VTVRFLVVRESSTHIALVIRCQEGTPESADLRLPLDALVARDLAAALMAGAAEIDPAGHAAILDGLSDEIAARLFVCTPERKTTH